MKPKVLLWGIGEDYEKMHNQILFEEYKNNLEVIALVAKREDIYTKKRDGYNIVSKESLSELEFDYIIIASTRYYNEIRKEAEALGVTENRIINGKVFGIPSFDFRRYVNLIENPVTIISDDCWGGFVYSILGLPFSTPTINMWISKKSFIRFIGDIKYYCEQPLLMKRESDLREGGWPQGIIGQNEKEIMIDFNHSTSFDVARDEWEKRKRRINYENIFIKMAVEGCDPNKKEYLEAFEKCKYKKICFFSGEVEKKLNTTYLKSFEAYCINKNRKGLVPDYSHTNFSREMSNILYSLDLLKLLNGEADFLRE